ncbi:hypothetical protein AB0L86_31495, partial [Micromonospora musae]|uniref:hypothetical protein n=1 Tax=Micromonospora musae TaxID=1894970 RepID=UPI0034171F62
LRSQTPDSLTFDEALKLLTRPDGYFGCPPTSLLVDWAGNRYRSRGNRDARCVHVRPPGNAHRPEGHDAS